MNPSIRLRRHLVVVVLAKLAFLAWFGHWLDGKVGNQKPWFLIAGAVLGMTGGFISFFRQVLGKTKK